jgi:threonine/homoserine/homoserine lactone efflux protein
MEKINLFGYILFAFSTAITPGPNNIILFSNGKKFGIKNSVTLMLGISLGFSVLLYLSGYGIGEIVSKDFTIGFILKIVSSVWFIFLAYTIRKMSMIKENIDMPKVGFKEGFLMQFINLKAWLMAINAAAAFFPTFKNIHFDVFIFTFIFALVGAPCMVIWVKFGELISKLFKTEKSNKIIGNFLGLLMIISIFTIWVK